MKKGVSTVIATILMLVITIALAGMTFSYLTTTFSTQTSKVIDLAGSPDCSANTITVVIRNSGTDTINVPSELQFYVGSTLDSTPGCSATNLGVGNSTLCNTLNGAAGSNSIRIVGPSNTIGPVNAIC